jgi:predicted nucleic acid-binding protein
VTEVVLDASVVLKWFSDERERHLAAARSLRTAFEVGELIVFAPPLLHPEIVNVAGRRWHWDETALTELVADLIQLGFELEEPELGRVAHWTARGLTAYDAAYVAVAEAQSAPLVTDDDSIVAIAPTVAVALAVTDETRRQKAGSAHPPVGRSGAFLPHSPTSNGCARRGETPYLQRNEFGPGAHRKEVE